MTSENKKVVRLKLNKMILFMLWRLIFNGINMLELSMSGFFYAGIRAEKKVLLYICISIIPAIEAGTSENTECRDHRCRESGNAPGSCFA
jgi:hypothetical protein